MQCAKNVNAMDRGSHHSSDVGVWKADNSTEHCLRSGGSARRTATGPRER